MSKRLFLMTLCAVSTCALAQEDLSVPPSISNVPATATESATPADVYGKGARRPGESTTQAYEASQLNPTAQDVEKARAQREENRRNAGGAKREPFVSEMSGTKIQETVDNDNRVTEVTVTPGSTSIPYTMRNRSDRPIDTTPGQNPGSTLDTPKFIEFGW